MKKIKQPSVAGTFYTGNPAELKNQIDMFALNSKNTYEAKTRAVIVPHAGLVYSGQLAYEGISQLDKNIKNLFIFAPAHRVGFLGLALSSFDIWQTPFGEIEINQEINQELINKFNAQYNDEAIQPEHALEIQVPIIQKTFQDVKIIPILIGQETPEIVEKIITEYYPNPEYGFIISSDLSHFHRNEDAVKIDNITAQMIENGLTNRFSHEQACGATGIIGLVNFANKNHFSLIRINMTNSSKTTGDKSSVVGYGCWFLYEGSKNEFIKKYYSNFIINLCKLSIKSKFETKEIELKFPQVFNEPGASFVTLEKNNMLRGCIGSIIAHRTLIEDIAINAQNAAFNDPRFNPVQKEEIEQLHIDVSILSEPTPIEFDGEEDLLNKIKPFEDGIIIKDGNYQAVYLPTVWEQLPDKKEFLNSLKRKAGLSPDYFSKTFEAYRFQSTLIEQ